MRETRLGMGGGTVGGGDVKNFEFSACRLRPRKCVRGNQPSIYVAFANMLHSCCPLGRQGPHCAIQSCRLAFHLLRLSKDAHLCPELIRGASTIILSIKRRATTGSSTCWVYQAWYDRVMPGGGRRPQAIGGLRCKDEAGYSRASPVLN